jgi:hypothetical protein
MELEPVGVKTAEEQKAFEPVTIPVVAYSTQNGKAITSKIDFLPKPPPKSALALINLAGKNDELTGEQIEQWVRSCMHPDSMDRWEWLTSSTDVNLEYETVVQVYMALMGFYGGKRPTAKRPSSRSGTPRTQRTTTVASRKRASTSKVSK